MTGVLDSIIKISQWLKQQKKCYKVLHLNLLTFKIACSNITVWIGIKYFLIFSKTWMCLMSSSVCLPGYVEYCRLRQQCHHRTRADRACHLGELPTGRSCCWSNKAGHYRAIPKEGARTFGVTCRLQDRAYKHTFDRLPVRDVQRIKLGYILTAKLASNGCDATFLQLLKVHLIC